MPVIDKPQIIHLLQHHMAGVEQDVATRVVAGEFQKAPEGCAIVQVFSGMQFIAEVHALLVKTIEDRCPAPSQFRERLINQGDIARRPRIEIGPGQRAGKRGMGF